MKYIDNLIAWGDQLFRRDTMESINEATTLYVLAYELLGRRPVKVPSASHEDKSYEELIADGALDPFGNRSVPALIENFVAPPTVATATPRRRRAAAGHGGPLLLHPARTTSSSATGTRSKIACSRSATA